ncbi:MAG: hypothetical protein H0W83_08155 [Planctomycetes bacterium]|nr:hypothetical protein [Planctomycetota bacterium]
MSMTRPSMNRQGMVLTAVIVVIAGAAGIIGITIAAQGAHRRSEVSERAARIQGREWCRGAQAMAEGAEVRCGAWEITRSPGSERIARGPHGTYRISSDGRESWTPTGSGR